MWWFFCCLTRWTSTNQSSTKKKHTHTLPSPSSIPMISEQAFEQLGYVFHFSDNIKQNQNTFRGVWWLDMPQNAVKCMTGKKGENNGWLLKLSAVWCMSKSLRAIQLIHLLIIVICVTPDTLNARAGWRLNNRRTQRQQNQHIVRKPVLSMMYKQLFDF